MPAAYIIGNIDVQDLEVYEKYRAQVPELVAKYGGEYLVRGGRFERLEGAEPLPRFVLLKFPSYEQALAWYNSADYQPLAQLRQSGSIGNLIVVEGAD